MYILTVYIHHYIIIISLNIIMVFQTTNQNFSCLTSLTSPSPALRPGRRPGRRPVRQRFRQGHRGVGADGVRGVQGRAETQGVRVKLLALDGPWSSLTS